MISFIWTYVGHAELAAGDPDEEALRDDTEGVREAVCALEASAHEGSPCR